MPPLCAEAPKSGGMAAAVQIMNQRTTIFARANPIVPLN
jgi:hypothetical protein